MYKAANNISIGYECMVTIYYSAKNFRVTPVNPLTLSPTTRFSIFFKLQSSINIRVPAINQPAPSQLQLQFDAVDFNVTKV